MYGENIITFRGTKPAAALLLDLWRKVEPWEPEYQSTKGNIIRVTEELMHPMYINAAHESLTDLAKEYPDLADEIEECRDALRGMTIDLAGNYDAQVKYYNDEGYGPTTRVWVLFINYKNGKADLRLYRNRAAAKGQVTKFFNRVIRLS
jgi:hypothetical protein